MLPEPISISYEAYLSSLLIGPYLSPPPSHPVYDSSSTFPNQNADTVISGYQYLQTDFLEGVEKVFELIISEINAAGRSEAEEETSSSSSSSSSSSPLPLSLTTKISSLPYSAVTYSALLVTPLCYECVLGLSRSSPSLLSSTSGAPMFEGRCRVYTPKDVTLEGGKVEEYRSAVERHIESVSSGEEPVTLRVWSAVYAEEEVRTVKETGDATPAATTAHTLLMEAVVNRRGGGGVEWSVVDFDNLEGGAYFEEPGGEE